MIPGLRLRAANTSEWVNCGDIDKKHWTPFAQNFMRGYDFLERGEKKSGSVGFINLVSLSRD